MDQALPPAATPITRAELLQRIRAALADNTSQYITPEDIRSRLVELTESAYMLVDPAVAGPPGPPGPAGPQGLPGGPVLTFSSLGMADDGSEQTLNFKAALNAANGRPITGEGRSYALGNTATGAAIDVPIDIRDVTFTQFAPTTDVAKRLLYFAPTTEKLCRLTNVKYDMGTNKSAGTSADGAAIYVVTARVEFDNVEVTGHGRGSAMQIQSCNAPSIVRPYIHDMLYRWDGDPLLAEELQGIRLNNCNASYVADPRIHHLGGEHHWITGEAITATRGIQYRWYGNNAYQPTTTGTTGTSPPVHTSGTVSDGGVSWLWIGPAEASVRWLGGALALSRNEGASIYGGLIHHCGEGVDISGGAGEDNADYAFYGIRFEDCDSYGFKLAHTYKRVRLYAVTAIRSGIDNFVFTSGVAGDRGKDVKAYDCYSLNPGITTRWNDVPEELWVTAHYGFGVVGAGGGSSDKGKLINCVAVDDQASPTMDYGFRDEDADGNWELEDCYATGFVTAATLGFKTVGWRKQLGFGTTVYVRAGGDDANPGYINDDANAFATIQGAATALAGRDFNGQTISIRLADGTWTAGATFYGSVPGQRQSSDYLIIGNTASPANVHVNVASGSAFTALGGARVRFQDMKISAVGNCIDVQNHSVAEYQNIIFGAAQRHVSVVRNSRVTASGNYEVAGNALNHIFAQDASYVGLNNRTVTLNSALAFTTFLSTTGCCPIRADSLVFSGAGVAGTTGKKHDVTLNSTVRGTPVFPGDVAGTTATGGQYA